MELSHGVTVVHSVQEWQELVGAGVLGLLVIASSARIFTLRRGGRNRVRS